MTYEAYRYIFIGGAILGAVMFAVTVALFFFLKIPKVIGDLSGRTARKAIESIRNQNESTGDKVYRSSPVNKERGKLTDKISPSGRLIHNPTDVLGGAMATEKIGTQKLSPEETTVLGPGASETTVLSQEMSTGVLEQAEGIFEGEQAVFAIEFEITYIHTNELIATEVTP